MTKMKFVLILLITLKEILFAQYSDFNRVTVLDTNKDYSYYTILVGEENGLEKTYLFYVEPTNLPAIYLTTKVKGSPTWREPRRLYEGQGISKLSALCLSPNKILLAYLTPQKINIISSTDNGKTWSQPTSISPLTSISEIKLLKMKNNEVGLIYIFRPELGSTRLFLLRSSDEGRNWSSGELLLSNLSSADLILTNSGEYFLFYTDPDRKIIRMKTSNNLTNWSQARDIFSTQGIIRSLSASNDSLDKIILAYDFEYPEANSITYNSDIFTLTTTNYGNNWSNSQLTFFKGVDRNPLLFFYAHDYLFGFVSNRMNGYNQIYYGYLSVNKDLSPPPYIYYVSLYPTPTQNELPSSVRAIADGNASIKKVTAFLKKDNENYKSVELKDDGTNYDSLPNDKIFGGFIPFRVEEGNIITYYALVEDQNRNQYKSREEKVNIPLSQTYSYYYLGRNWSLPVSYFGNLGEPAYLLSGTRYLSFRVLWSAGFLLSGYNVSEIWANGLFESRSLWNYSPGIVGSFPYQNDPFARLYVIKSTDPPFNGSWLSYRGAVHYGAPFYDGDKDGFYNPVDKNNNGQWDPDEDAPEMIGEVTTWCVINDTAQFSGAIQDSKTMGIEVQLSVFDFSLEGSGFLDDQVFVRYRIINRGIVNPVLDSVIFSFYVDPDIEEFNNDYLGCDTTLNLGYAYSGFDKEVNNPPAIGVALLQGPPVYIPNETFIDIDNDGKFTPNIDTPIDTAVFKYGSNISSKIFPGAKNQNITSYFKKLVYIGYLEPITASGYRMWQNSIHHDGQMTDPCNDPFGVVIGNVNCSDVNKKFLFSGDPFNRNGWINTFPDFDATFLLSTGPFKLEKDVPIDIWGVFVGGRGYDSLHSVEILKENTRKAIEFYKNLPTIYEKPEIPTEYVLYQNYPNPFNAGTTIKWRMPQKGRVTIKIYDIIGREIEKVEDNFYDIGEHSIRFSPGNKLSSGVYFYQLKTENFIETKKMVLIK